MERVREDVQGDGGRQGGHQQRPAWTVAHAVSLWENAAEMQAYEKSDLYQKEFAPALQPFFVGEYKTYRCEVKYMQ